MLRFADAASTAARGAVLEIVDGTRLPGLIGLAADGQLDHLELFGASRSVPQLVSPLDVPAPPPREMFGGSVELAVTTAEDQSWVRIDFADPTGDPEREFTVRAPSTGALLATLTREPRGPLHALTFYAFGRLLEPLLAPG